jgi:hypothetical protein
MLIEEQQKSAKEYAIQQTVYMIVILTAPYKVLDKSGNPVLDEVLLLNLNPQTLQGEIRDLYGHQFVCLNPNHPDQQTPHQIRDWLDLIYQSIHNRERPVLNTSNAGIKRAAELINFDNLSYEERTKAKNAEAMRVSIAKIESERSIEIAKSLLATSLSDEEIALHTGISLEQVQQLRQETK